MGWLPTAYCCFCRLFDAAFAGNLLRSSPSPPWGGRELGLQGFNLAQNRSPLAVMLIFGGMLSALQNGESLEPMLKALARDFQTGLDAELVIARKLEDGWERPLQEWRQELRLNMN